MSFFDKLFKKTTKNFTKTSTDISQQTDDNLLEIGDVILLHWLDTSSTDRFPSYFEIDYFINPQLHRNKLIRLGLLEDQKSERSLKKLRVSELKEILNKENFKTSGKKDTLIERIMENIEVFETVIPSSLCATALGKQVLNDKQYLIKAHQDRHITPIEYSDYLSKFPNLNFDEIKSSILNDRMSKNVNLQQFGLVRNDNHAFAEMYRNKKEYYLAMEYYIKVLLLDCSGLSNNYDYIKNPIYLYPMANSFIVTELRNCAENCDLDDYNRAFEVAKKYLKSFKKKIFLNEKDFLFIRNNLLTENLYVIEDYLEKYKKFDSDYYR